jgi:hypothetical protein
MMLRNRVAPVLAVASAVVGRKTWMKRITQLLIFIDIVIWVVGWLQGRKQSAQGPRA